MWKEARDRAIEEGREPPPPPEFEDPCDCCCNCCCNVKFGACLCITLAILCVIIFKPPWLVVAAVAVAVVVVILVAFKSFLPSCSCVAPAQVMRSISNWKSQNSGQQGNSPQQDKSPRHSKPAVMRDPDRVAQSADTSVYTSRVFKDEEGLEASVKMASWPLSVVRSYNASCSGHSYTSHRHEVRVCEGDEDRRRDPEDGVWRTYREIVQMYGAHHNQSDIDSYWDFMR